MLLSASTQLQSLDRGIVPILGDGNCLFRALSKLTYGSEEWHSFMRQTLIDFVSLNREVFQSYCTEDITDHLSKMKYGALMSSCRRQHLYLSYQFMCSRKKAAVVTTTGKYSSPWKSLSNFPIPPLKGLEALITTRSATLLGATMMSSH